jgi:hypothetical protein
VIESADEYKHRFDAPDSIERFRKLALHKRGCSCGVLRLEGMPGASVRG